MSKLSASEMAVHIAVLIDRDPVMAAQIKEHIKPARLLELLDLNGEVAAQAAEQAVIQDPAPMADLAERDETYTGDIKREPICGERE